MRAFRVNLAKVAATGLACMFGCMGIGTADAVQVAGLQSPTGVEQTVGTDVLTIRLTQGNPEKDGDLPAGEIEGISIHLDRLVGLDPTKPADVSRIEGLSLTELQNWQRDRQRTQVTDARGETTFENLATGFYVVSSSAPSDSYREISEFIVAVPFHSIMENPTPVPGVIVAKTHIPGTPLTPPVTPPETPTISTTSPPNTPPISPSTSTASTAIAEVSTTPPNSSGSTTKSGSLAITGAQVVRLVIIAAILLGAGFILIVVGRKKNMESEGR